MKLRRLKFKLWMLEILVWIVGLFWAMSAGAFGWSSNIRLTQSLQFQQTPSAQDPLRGAARARLQAAYGRLPLGFESNSGQAERSVFFLSRSTSASLLFRAREVELQFRSGTPSSPTNR